MKFFYKNKLAGYLVAASVFFATTAEASFSFITNLPKVSSNFKANTLVFSLGQPQDTTKLAYPLKKDDAFATEKKTRTSFDLETPSNITVSVEYDPKAKQYVIYEKVGKYNIKPPRVMSEDEYRSYQFENSMREYWRKKSAGESFDAGTGLLPRMQVNSETFDRIFGSNVIEIIPEGSAELSFGLNHTKSESPGMTIDQRKSTTFDFKSKIQMNVNGKVGDKLKMTVQYNTEATFDFENNVKVEYTGYEDEIIQKIEAGNVSLPLPGTLITGSQSLFGFKTQLKFGRLNITSVISKQNGQSQVIEVKGGAQTTEFSVNADEYDANKHYFLSPYFRNNYNAALRELPIINSNVRITKVEVWITNNSQNYVDSRDLLGFVDLGESAGNLFESSLGNKTGPPSNDLNNLYTDLKIYDTASVYRDLKNLQTIMENSGLLKPNFKEGRGYEKIQIARKLLPNEYSVNTYLGYISLNSPLGSNQQLAVAYEYTIDGQRYQVGEFSTDGIDSPKPLFLKLLAGMDKSPRIKPLWDLMMKNIYKLGNVYQVSKEDFLLDVYYHDDKVGTDLRYLTDGGPNVANKPLISLLNLDNLNSQNDQKPDGIFDFLDDVPNNTGDVKVPITINAQYGRVIFPIIEPFGKDLRAKIGNNAIADKYVYQEIYDSTLSKAQKVSRKNKFKIAGSLRSTTSSEISLNAANVPKGSVVVTAGGAKLEEGIDYSVDYNLGSVRIIKPGLIESGMPIRISLENNALFNFQTKTLIGTHLDYKISDKFNVGATIMNLTERPLTQKVNFGNEAISNTIWGLNTSFETESSFLTKMVDFLPLIQTKEKSKITFDAEFAQLLPGYSKSIGKNGTVFIDDFESSSTPFDLTAPLAWKLASIPKGQTDYLFPDASYYNDIRGGFHRAQLAWFKIEPIFLRQESENPSYIRNSDKLRSSHWVREIYEKELFPYKNTPQGQPTNIPVLNLTFYPYERGPYNYNTNLTADGLFPSNTIKSNWGGIMRGVTNSDFEAQNINYIEFWLMDPFVYDTINDWGGDLYFNLGTLSEDILPDGHYAFEGGLPYPGEYKNFDVTQWGRQPKYTIPNYFNQANKKYQDIGLDGLSSRYDIDGDGVDDEINFFSDYLSQIQGIVGANPSVYEQFANDPSNDDYMYFLDPYYTTVEATILDRYKKVNNTEGNSASSTTTNQQATQLADGESIDDNLSHNTVESYFQYKVSLRHEDMEVGKNFITSKVIAYADMPAYSKKQKIAWYQFKVPIDKPEKTIGDPSLTNITAVRMVLKGFTDTLNLRFAKLQFIRDEWRKYDNPMVEGQEGMPSADLSNGLLNISAVNLEENSNRTPINYVLPPKLSRSTDPSQSQTVELNEQSMELKVTDLAEGDARAAIKNINYDIRKYRKLKMDVHAEEIPGFPIKDDEVTVFLRLGTDNTDNYYEYEVPLKITPPPPGGRYSNNSEADRQAVWPHENMLDIDLEKFTDTKLARNDASHKSGSNILMSTIYVTKDGENRVKVKGNPSLSNIRVLMIGVRNPGKSSDPNSDGLSKSVIVWVNELRVSNTTNEAGWAANARLSARLADLGTLAITGATSKPGFGSIESKVADRTSEDFYQYDLTTTMEVGRFFPSKWGVKIPMYFGYGESFSNPQYNPLDPDIPLRVAIKKAANESDKDSIKNVAQDYTRRKSINFTNVKIDRQDAKNWPLALSNFSVSYSYNETFSRNIKIDHKVDREIRGALTYNYNTNLKPFYPLKKVNFLNSKYLRIVKDFNFTPVPSQFSFRTELVRNYFEQQLRNISNTSMQFEPTYSKDFMWNRVYSINWDLTQSLRFDFNANNMAIIDEPEGVVDRKYRNEYDHWRDSVIHNILNFGRNKEYSHQFNFTYNVPLNKIPFIDWTAVSAKYSGNYRWETGPILADTSRFDPGNKIQNSNIIQVTGQLNLAGLYNKWNYLKLLNQKFDQIGRGVPPKKAMKTVKFEESGIKLKANQSKSINHKLKTETVSVKVYNDKGAEIKVKMEVKSDERLTIKADNDFENVKVVVEGKVPEKINPLKVIAESSIRLMMGLKNVSVSLSDNRGMYLPGYKPSTKYLGMNDVNGVYAPGLAFVAGWQDPEFAWYAINHGWLTKDTTFNDQFRLTYSENVTFRALYEPMPNFKVEINAIRTYSRNQSQTYRANEFGQFGTFSPNINGNYSISVISAGSAFKSPAKVFNRFKESRLTIARRLYTQRDKHAFSQPYEWGTGKFPTGYGELSQQVLIPSFLSAYSQYSPSNVPLDNFPAIPMPNWQITYDGLAKLGFFKEYFRTFTLTHGYRSVYSIGAYTANLKYDEEGDGYSWVKNSIGDFISQRDITNVSIIEQFSPLIGLDMNWVNNLTTRFEVKTSRSLAMSFSNNQLTQTNAWEYIIGGGYRFENMPLIFGPEEGKQRTLKSDLRLRLDFSIRNNETVLHKMVEEISIKNAGMITTTIKASADYQISTQVTFRAFFDWGKTKPTASNLSYPQVNSSFGFSLRFTMI